MLHAFSFQSAITKGSTIKCPARIEAKKSLSILFYDLSFNIYTSFCEVDEFMMLEASTLIGRLPAMNSKIVGVNIY